jgi:MFS superfamily sulfate permease-like transporter
VAALATAGTAQYAELTAALALLVGLITVLAGLFRLGVVARFFSPSVLVGFVTGLALVISIKQVPKILGVEAGEGDFWERLWDILVHLGDVHGTTLLVGLLTIAVMLAASAWRTGCPPRSWRSCWAS